MADELTLAQKFRVHAALHPNGLEIHMTRDQALAFARLVEMQQRSRDALEKLDRLNAQLAADHDRIDRHEHWLCKIAIAQALFFSLVAWAGWI